MSEIIPLLVCLTPHLTSTSLNQMSHIIFAMLCISGRVTTLGLSQYWGLEDFMIISPTAVTNAVNLAFFMVNFSVLLIRPFRQRQPGFRVLDLKAHYRAQRYLHETIKRLPISPDPDLIAGLECKVLSLGAVHRSKTLQPAA